MSVVIIIDSGVSNIRSIGRALDHLEVSYELDETGKKIHRAGHLILPGVGSFESGMNGLKKNNLLRSISEFVKKGNPLLGICLGMQLLFERSEEFGCHEGLKLIDGNVKEIPSGKENNLERKIPHVGWNCLLKKNKSEDLQSPLFNGLCPNDYYYFVHSFMAVPRNKKHILATTKYCDLEIVAAVKKENVTGVQFHPEKSGPSGLKLLKNFVSGSD